MRTARDDVRGVGFQPARLLRIRQAGSLPYGEDALPSATSWLLNLGLMLVFVLEASSSWAQTKAPIKKVNADPAFNSEALKPGEAHDVLSMVKLPDHNLRGTWKRQDGAIVCEPSADAQLLLPVAVSGSYEIDCEFTRRTNKECIVVVFPVGGTSTAIVLSGWAGAASGIAITQGREARDVPLTTGAATRPGPLKNGQRNCLQIEVNVLKDRVSILATLNNQRIVQWKGLAGQVSYWPQYTVPCIKALAFLSNENAADLHKFEITLKKDCQAYRLDDAVRTDWLNPLTDVADAPPKLIAAQCGDFKGRKYYISDKPMDIVVARRMAAQLQGRLLTISSQAENDFILKEARGVPIWLSGWRSSGSNVWRDERNRPLKYFGFWAPANPELRYWESTLAINTASSEWKGWHDTWVTDQFHACIEWGAE